MEDQTKLELQQTEENTTPETVPEPEQAPDPMARSRGLIQVLAGGYLLYLAWKIFCGIRDGGATGGRLVGLIAVIVVFVAAGAFFIVRNLLGRRK